MRKIKLSQWAKENAVCYRTAWNRFKAGFFKGKSEVAENGTILIICEDEEPAIAEGEKLEKPLQDFMDAARGLCNFLHRRL